MKEVLKMIGIGVLCLVVLGSCINIYTDNKSFDFKDIIYSIMPQSTPVPEIEPIQLSNGNYIAGEDFPSGKYNIVAIAGGGNVMMSNTFSGGITAIMGVANDGFYQKEYKNINFPSGTVLEIKNGLTIELIQK